MMSRRQKQVCERLLLGMTDKQIAADLGISIETVAHHLRKVYKKLKVDNRTEAAVIFSKQLELAA